MRTISKSYGSGKFRIRLDAFSTAGHGLTVVITGGESGHLGGAALANPGIAVHGKILSHCDLWTLTVPGHKDAELAQKVAKTICTSTEEPTLVSAGIHVENASKEEIKLLCDNCMKAVDSFLNEYCGEKTGAKKSDGNE